LNNPAIPLHKLAWTNAPESLAEDGALHYLALSLN
jgi:hypothetical protein